MNSRQCERTKDCPSRAVYQYGSCHSGASRNLARGLNCDCIWTPAFAGATNGVHSCPSKLIHYQER
jgi:hypothetical protein